MSYLDNLIEAKRLISLANRLGWKKINAGEIDKILNEKTRKFFIFEVTNMFRKDILATAIALGIVDRALHPKSRATLEFYGMLISIILAYADKLPGLKSISALADFASRNRLTLKTTALIMFILWFFDILFGAGSYGFEFLAGIGEKYGFAFSTEGIVGVFKQLANDIKSAFRKEKKEEYGAPTVITVEEKEKVKEEEVPIIRVPESI